MYTDVFKAMEVTKQCIMGTTTRWTMVDPHGRRRPSSPLGGCGFYESKCPMSSGEDPNNQVATSDHHLLENQSAMDGTCLWCVCHTHK